MSHARILVWISYILLNQKSNITKKEDYILLIREKIPPPSKKMVPYPLSIEMKARLALLEIRLQLLAIYEGEMIWSPPLISYGFIILWIAASHFILWGSLFRPVKLFIATGANWKAFFLVNILTFIWSYY